MRATVFVLVLSIILPSTMTMAEDADLIWSVLPGASSVARGQCFSMNDPPDGHATEQATSIDFAGPAGGIDTSPGGDKEAFATQGPQPDMHCEVEPPEAEICQGESVEFCVLTSGGIPPFTYLWSNGSTESCIGVITAGTYIVEVTDSEGYTTMCHATLTVNPNPTCEVEPPEAEICQGQSVEFCAIPDGGTPPYAYVWSHGSTDPCVTVSVPGTYTVEVTDAEGCATSCQATLMVTPGPICTVEPPEAEICQGQSVEFCAIADGGTPPYAYVWSHGSTDPCVTVSVPGTYTVEVTDAEGCPTSCQATLTVWPLPLCSLECPAEPIICGSSANMLVAQVAGDIVAYLWTLDPSDWYIEEDRGDTIIFHAGSSDMCRFTLAVTDIHGCEDTCQVWCQCQEPVPVVLTCFEAIEGQGFVALQWTTASEVNCDRWEIYRGLPEDGDYARVGEEPGHGSTESTQTYRWIDRRVVPGETYFYKLKQMDLDGTSWWSQVVSATAGAMVPEAYALCQNYPNPFNPCTEIRYQIPQDSHVTLTIRNVSGQEITTLVDGRRAAGAHTAFWNGRDAQGREVSAGIYFCTMETGEFRQTKKMVLLK